LVIFCTQALPNHPLYSVQRCARRDRAGAGSAAPCKLSISAPIEPPGTKQSARYILTRHSLTPATNCPPCALSSESIECHYPRGIRSLADGGCLAPISLGRSEVWRSLGKIFLGPRLWVFAVSGRAEGELPFCKFYWWREKRGVASRFASVLAHSQGEPRRWRSKNPMAGV